MTDTIKGNAERRHYSLPQLSSVLQKNMLMNEYTVIYCTVLGKQTLALQLLQKYRFHEALQDSGNHKHGSQGQRHNSTCSSARAGSLPTPAVFDYIM